MRMIRKTLAAAVACTAVVGGVAAAHTEVFPTRMTITGTGAGTTSSGFVGSVDGDLSSSNPKCLPHRTVKLFFNSDGTSTLVDVDLSSSNGAWGVRGHAAAEPDSFTVRVTRKRIDRSLGSAHHHICRRNKLTAAFFHFPGP